jgi:hypothetical protein
VLQVRFNETADHQSPKASQMALLWGSNWRKSTDGARSHKVASKETAKDAEVAKSRANLNKP